MIGHISGTFDHRDGTKIIIDCGGVGFELTVTNSVLMKLPRQGEKLKVLTHMAVREDAMQLFGFSSKEEKALFLNLISVSGIGPKGAMSILSSFEIKNLVVAITKGDADYITSAQGIGKKTAQRVIIELKEKLGKLYSLETVDSISGVAADEDPLMKDSVAALMALGYSAREAKKAVIESGIDLSGSPRIEDIIKKSLRNLS